MEVSWNGGTPSHHRFYFRIVHHKPSSYWVPPILGNLHILYWLVVWIIFYFSIYWECHHPNWRSHIFQRGRAQPPTRWYLRVTQPFDHLRKLAAGLCWKFGCPDEATRWKKSLWSLLNRLSFEMEWHDVETYVSCGRKLSLDPDIQSWSIHFFSESFGQFGTQRFQRSLWSFLCVLFWLVILEQVSQNSIRGTQVSAYHCYSLHIWSFIVYIYTQYIYIYSKYTYTVYSNYIHNHP